MIYNNQYLYPWHVNRNIFPSEKLTVEQKKPVGYFVFHNNKWQLVSGNLGSYGNRENAPPVTLKVPVPKSIFRVEIELTGSRNEAGYSGSVMAVKAQNDAAFRIVRFERPQGSQSVELGVYDCSSGYFEITLEEGHPRYPAGAHAFRFVPISQKAEEPPAQSGQERDEQLRALGYLGN